MPAETHPGTSVDPRVGRVLQDRYKVLAPIAEGAMGTVYRAERLTLGRPVAIKFLHAQLANEPLLVKRFEVEARAMSCLAHPNCVSVIDFGMDGLPYLVMDLVQGPSLRTLIEGGPVPAARALRIVRQMLAALSHAHGHGIIHRDIKPENVVIEAVAGIEDHVRVLDFGLAKFVGSQLKLTVGMTLGTPNYMAPELTREGSIDERVDLYATGVVLFELLTGRAPFHAPDVAEVFLRLLTMPPPRLREVSPRAGFSAELERVVFRSMAKQPVERFPSASVMGAALDAVPEAQARPRPPFRPPVEADTIAEPLPAFLREEYAPIAAAPPDRTPVKSRLDVWVETVQRKAGTIGARTQVALHHIRGRLHAGAGVAWVRIRALGTWIAGSRRRSLAAGAISLMLVSSLIGVAVTMRTGSGSSVSPSLGAAFVGPPAPAPAPAATAPTPDVPAGAADDREEAIKRLLELRRSEPRNAEHAVELTRLYFEKRWWSAGVDAARSAVQIDPKRRSDPALIRQVISALQSDKAGDQAAEYLRDAGAPARPHLRDAAKTHPSPRVRARAAEIVRASKRKPLFNWFGRR